MIRQGLRLPKPNLPLQTSRRKDSNFVTTTQLKQRSSKKFQKCNSSVFQEILIPQWKTGALQRSKIIAAGPSLQMAFFNLFKPPAKCSKLTIFPKGPQFNSQTFNSAISQLMSSLSHQIKQTQKFKLKFKMQDNRRND